MGGIVDVPVITFVLGPGKWRAVARFSAEDEELWCQFRKACLAGRQVRSDGRSQGDGQAL